jgi:hypothetical protein
VSKETGAAMYAPDVNGKPSLPKGGAPRGLLPSSSGRPPGPCSTSTPWVLSSLSMVRRPLSPGRPSLWSSWQRTTRGRG